MPSGSIDPQLLILRRQYLQLVDPDFLFWPPKSLLRDADVQEWLYKNLFQERQDRYLPPNRYQYRVLKALVAKIEEAIEDPEEDEISDSLMSHLSCLFSSSMPSEGEAVQQRAYVTFSHPPLLSGDHDDSTVEEDLTVTLLEKRNLISGSKTTGFRTWEAALHLATYLLTPAGRQIVAGKNIVELGAGTGFLSILCSKQLSSNHVTCTDGDEAVVESLSKNFFLNGQDSRASFTGNVLRWGHTLKDSWIEEDFNNWPYDVVLGADIIYDKTAVSALVATLKMLWQWRPSIQVLMASAIRNADTYEAFLKACGQYLDSLPAQLLTFLAHQQIRVEEIPFQAKSMRESVGMFYATAMPLKIISLFPPANIQAEDW